MSPKQGPLLFCNAKLFMAGGAENFALFITRAALTSAGEPSLVLSMEDPPGAPAWLRPGDRFFGLRLRPRWLQKLRTTAIFAWLIVRHRPRRVVFSHLYVARLGAYLCRPFGVPYWVVLHGAEVFRPVGGTLRSALVHAQTLVTTSEYNCALFSKVQGIPPERFTVIPCTVDSVRFFPGKKNPALVDKHALGAGPTLLTVSRLHPSDNQKGIDVVMRALPEIRKVHPGVRYLIVGDGAHRAFLQAYAKELGVDANVRFAGRISDAELPEYYRLADAFVMPSREGFGIVYLEALASGVPVVSGDADGSVAPLQGGMLGWRVGYKDSKAVARACLEILEKKDPRTNPQWLREKTVASFSEQKVTERVRKLFAA